MNNAVFCFPLPKNEPILEYRSGSEERLALESELARQSKTTIEIPLIINGREVYTGRMVPVRMPCEHGHIMANCHLAGEAELTSAMQAAMERGDFRPGTINTCISRQPIRRNPANM